MNSQAFLDNFGTIADAPGGVDRLRDLILDLAVNGTLTDQNPSDEPASELLDRIQSEKVAISARTGARQGKRPAPLAESPWDLPTGWVWTQLDALGFIAPRNDLDDSTTVGFVPMHLVPAALKEPHSFEERPWGEIKKSYTHVADGDVAVAKITPCFENGKSTVFESLPAGVGAATTELHVLRPTPGGVLPRYVLLYLKSPQFRREGETRMTGTAGQKRLPRDYFSGAPFPLPPLPEQARIVAKVDELMQLCDALEARQQARRHITTRLRASSLDTLTNAETKDELHTAWSRIHSHWETLTEHPDGIGAIRRAILELAVRGALVPQDPREGTGSDLVGKIRHASSGSGDGPISPSPSAHDLHPIPPSWVWLQLGEVIDEIEAGKSPTAQSRPKAGDEWGVLKVSACSWGSFRPEENKALLPETTPDPRFEVRTGDFLISRANTLELVARSVVVGNPPRRLLISDKTLRLTPAEGCDPEYLNLANLASAARSHYERNASGTSASMRNVSQTVIKSTPIPLPPTAEQRRVVRRHRSLLALCDELERSLQARQQAAERFATAVTAPIR